VSAVSTARIVAVVGPTATGKTALGEALAAALGGDVVCADSRQVYRELEIGTGKPSPAERARRPHHLFDALALGAPASAGWYARAAGAACSEIHAGGRVSVLVGGSGLYLHAARAGLAPVPPGTQEIRARIRAEGLRLGSEALHERLLRADPETAARLAPRDAQRIARALEVLEASGKPLSWWHRQPAASGAMGRWRMFEIDVPSQELAARIDRRTHEMFERGLMEEVRALVENGLAPALRALRAIGYDEALAVLDGELTREAAEARTSLRTRQLAKRQRTWSRHQLDAVRLDGERLDASGLEAAALAALAGFD
jgi:tRNA dimethylallyltransferase